jgi:hypothetical protein
MKRGRKIVFGIALVVAAYLPLQAQMSRVPS